jgi:hypothetical protein
VNELEWVVIKFMACQMSVCELSRIDECELLLSNVHNSFFFYLSVIIIVIFLMFNV